jgi:hypothetical protein
MELKEPIFGDTAYMQYLGWGIRHGMKIYRDLGSTDGPFIDFLQALIQIFLGQSDRGLRIGDITLQIVGSALIGIMLAPRRGLSPLARRFSIVAWSAATVAVWLSYYLAEVWWVTANREAFYSVWGCVGMVALYTSGTFSGRAASLTAFAGGYLTMSMCFGKPTGIIFPCAGALSLIVAEPAILGTRRLRIRMALYGAATCAVLFTLAVAIFGSIRGYFFWCIDIPFIGNKFVWRMDWMRLFLIERPDLRTVAVASLIVGSVAIAWGLLPRRAIALVISPTLHWLSFCAQARGFPHQALPALATAYTLALALAANLWELGDEEKTVGILAPTMLAFIGYHAFGSFEASPFRWNGDPAQWRTPVNSFCNPEKQAGAYLKAHTKPDDTILAYTPGPRGDNAFIILYYADRRTSSEFFYAPWLEPVELLPQSSVQPNARELAALKGMEERNRREACAAVMSRPPAAIAYVSLDRMAAVCPPVRKMLETDYGPATKIDDIHIHLRKPGF